MDGLKLMLDRYHTVIGSLNVAEVKHLHFVKLSNIDSISSHLDALKQLVVR